MAAHRSGCTAVLSAGQDGTGVSTAACPVGCLCREEEANYFARQLLMPIAVLARMQARTPQAIARGCGVSYAAACLRARDFERYDWYVLHHGLTAYDNALLEQFYYTPV